MSRLSWLSSFLGLFSLRSFLGACTIVASLAGCDGGPQCAIDTDCPLGQRCAADNTCQVVGATSDSGTPRDAAVGEGGVDGGRADAATRDSGAGDAGEEIDAAPAEEDAGGEPPPAP